VPRAVVGRDASHHQYPPELDSSSPCETSPYESDAFPENETDAPRCGHLTNSNDFQRPFTTTTQELATTRVATFYFAVIVRPDEIDGPRCRERAIPTEPHVRHAFVGYAPHFNDPQKLNRKSIICCLVVLLMSAPNSISARITASWPI
jgi:hypothetical protein